MREISEELLEKYFKGLCTEEEAAMVEASLLEDYEESDALTPLPEGYKEEMLEAIVSETAVRTGQRRVRVYTGLCGGGLYAVAGAALAAVDAAGKERQEG